MLVQVTASTRMSATRSLFSISSCSDIGAGTASAGRAKQAATNTRLSVLSNLVTRPPSQLPGRWSIARLTAAAWNLDRLAGRGGQLGDEGLIDGIAAGAPAQRG